MHQIPKVSILMSVYNAELYLDETIKSILSQTFIDFEFLIVDDKSTDDSLLILKKYTDKRIKLFENEINKGYVKSLNFLISISRGKYLARQDADDISDPIRLFEQVEFLDNNPDTLMCGSNFYTIGERMLRSNVPINDCQIRSYLLFNNPICHSTVMMKKTIFSDFCPEMYDHSMIPSEDYALWFEVSKYGKIANLAKNLLQYRIHDSNISSRKKTVQIETANKVRTNAFKELLNYDLNQEETELINLLFNEELFFPKNELEKIINFFDIIIIQNNIKFKVDNDSLKEHLFIFLLRITLRNKSLKFTEKIRYFFKSKVFDFQILFKYIYKKCFSI